MSNSSDDAWEGLHAHWTAAKARQKDYRTPDDIPLLQELLSVQEKLMALGWREEMYCPRDGSTFLAITAGSSGVFPCRWLGQWPEGSFFLEDAGDLWPGRPVMWKPMPAPTASGAIDQINANIPRLECLPGVRQVLAERWRQLKLGWTPRHDDEHWSGDLHVAARCYLFACEERQLGRPDDEIAAELPKTWPWDKKYWKPKSQQRDLVRAAALILAELDRIDRQTRQLVKP